MTKSSKSAERLTFDVGADLRLVAEAWGDPSAPPVVLLHGGGQTRHAWSGSAQALAERGLRAIALDQRGHGDSSWALDGDYRVEAFASDLAEIAMHLERPPALVGASLGGLAALAVQVARTVRLSALVLVDITPRLEETGVARILEFMRASPDGFASLDEAADAVAAYLPHRPRPADLSGLEKNLRRGEDGRLRWHWDPKLVTGAKSVESTRRDVSFAEVAPAVDVPTLLIRGKQSDVVSETTALEFLRLVPHAEYVDLAGAAHMVAGDRNDAFTGAVADFLARVLEIETRPRPPASL